MSEQDYVDRALTTLAAERYDEVPDRALERRLLAKAQFHAPRPGAKRVPVMLALLGLCGATAAATVGSNWMESWWFDVEVEGEPTSGILPHGEPVVIPFVTDAGDRGAVRIKRELDAAGDAQTLIQIESQGEHFIEKEELQESSSAADWRRYPLEELRGTLSLFVADQAPGPAYEFFGQTLAGGGSRLLLLRHDDFGNPVIELARLPFDLLAAESEVEFSERPGGGHVISITNGSDAVMEFSWPPTHGAQALESAELKNHDGSVQVNLKVLPRESSSAD